MRRKAFVFEPRRRGATCALVMRVSVAVAVVLLAMALVAGHAEARAQGPDVAAAKAAAASFLARYALSSGRIGRIDQGGDTVSAGQAYGMLISAALDERQRFGSIWRWTQTNLQRSDSLLASHWRQGRVIDPKSASDADLDAARALLLASTRFHARTYRQAGLALARAILGHETERLGPLLVLLAGSWAHKPAFVDPGYWSPRTFELLAAATHDNRFEQLEQSASRLGATLTASPPHLPPDWAIVTAGGVAEPVAGPPGFGREPTPRYSLDAARMPIRFAEACDANTTRIPAAMWPFFSTKPPNAIGFAYSLDGRLLAPQQTATLLVGAAAAAQSAHQSEARDGLLAQAEAINTRFPTYFGSAWIAIGRLELDTALLGSCH